LFRHLAASIFLSPILRKGADFVEKWLDVHCKLVSVDDTADIPIPPFLKWKEQFRDAGDQQLGCTQGQLFEIVLISVLIN